MWLWGNHDYLDAEFLSLLFPSPPCSEYPIILVLMSVKGQTLRQSAEWEQAGSDELPLLHASARAHTSQFSYPGDM